MNEASRITSSKLQLLEKGHHALLALCLELEELAAELESGKVPRHVKETAIKVEPLVTSAHTLEEESFYPSLEEHANSCFGSLMIAQIKSEHRVDRRAAHELALTLRALADRSCRLSLETVAAMARGFQEYVRRHIAAEQMLLDTLLVVENEDTPEPVVS